MPSRKKLKLESVPTATEINMKPITKRATSGLHGPNEVRRMCNTVGGLTVLFRLLSSPTSNGLPLGIKDLLMDVLAYRLAIYKNSRRFMSGGDEEPFQRFQAFAGMKPSWTDEFLREWSQREEQNIPYREKHVATTCM